MPDVSRRWWTGAQWVPAEEEQCEVEYFARKRGLSQDEARSTIEAVDPSQEQADRASEGKTKKESPSKRQSAGRQTKEVPRRRLSLGILHQHGSRQSLMCNSATDARRAVHGGLPK